MAGRLLRICLHGGCNTLVPIDAGPRCPKHTEEHRTRRRGKPERRGTRSQRGYDARWYREFRDPYISEHPLCEQCEREGRTTAATDVDHITPHEGNEALLYCWTNLQSLCGLCHRRKTARERKA